MTDNQDDHETLSPVDQAEERNRILDQVLTVFAGILVPGLGQLLQKRFLAAAGMFFLLALSIFFFRYVGVYALIFYVYVLLFSSIDTAMNIDGDVKYRARYFIVIGKWPLFLVACAMMLLPAVQSAREAARLMQCHCQFKQIAFGLHNYHDIHKCLPPAYTVDENGKPLHSWRVLILPYIEQKDLHDKIRLDEPWDSEYNSQFHELEFSMFSCPSSSQQHPMFKHNPELKKSGNCFMSVVIGEGTAFPYSDSVTFKDIHDGTSDTLLLVERVTPICWMDPNNEIRYEQAVEGVNKNLLGLGSMHPKCCTVALCDGSTRSLPDDLDPKVLREMLTRNGGKPSGWE